MRHPALAIWIVFTATACADSNSPLAPTGALPPTRAAAAQSTPEPGDFEYTSTVCGFQVRIQIAGQFKEILLPGDRLFEIFPASTATLTNPANGRRETISNTGTFHITFLPNGNVEFVMNGRNTVEDEELGLLLTIGTFSYVFGGGGVVQPLQGKGTVVDLCDLLS